MKGIENRGFETSSWRRGAFSRASITLRRAEEMDRYHRWRFCGYATKIASVADEGSVHWPAMVLPLVRDYGEGHAVSSSRPGRRRFLRRRRGVADQTLRRPCGGVGVSQKTKKGGRQSRSPGGRWRSQTSTDGLKRRNSGRFCGSARLSKGRVEVEVMCGRRWRCIFGVKM